MDPLKASQVLANFWLVFTDGMQVAERRGLDATLASAPLADLAALSDSARYARRTALAKRVLMAERKRFPASGVARDAAFFLGRIAEDEGSGALEWYDRYLAESPRGTYASQALGRKMMIVYQARGAVGARVIAADYLERPDMLRELLTRGGLDPNYPTVEGVTLLHALCHKDSRGRTMDHRTECAAILLEFGADPSPKDTHGETPVMWATKHALTDIAGFLKARGAT
jgi:hypothetical protein